MNREITVTTLPAGLGKAEQIVASIMIIFVVLSGLLCAGSIGLIAGIQTAIRASGMPLTEICLGKIGASYGFWWHSQTTLAIADDFFTIEWKCYLMPSAYLPSQYPSGELMVPPVSSSWS